MENLQVIEPDSSSYPYPEDYCMAYKGFKMDIADIIGDKLNISYLIFYGQPSNSVILDITNDLPKQVKVEIKESFKRNFKSFSICFRNA